MTNLAINASNGPMLSTSSSSSSSSSFYVGLFDYRARREDVVDLDVRRICLDRFSRQGRWKQGRCAIQHSTRRVDEVNGGNNGAWCRRRERRRRRSRLPGNNIDGMSLFLYFSSCVVSREDRRSFLGNTYARKMLATFVRNPPIYDQSSTRFESGRTPLEARTGLRRTFRSIGIVA